MENRNTLSFSHRWKTNSSLRGHAASFRLVLSTADETSFPSFLFFLPSLPLYLCSCYLVFRAPEFFPSTSIEQYRRPPSRSLESGTRSYFFHRRFRKTSRMDERPITVTWTERRRRSCDRDSKIQSVNDDHRRSVSWNSRSIISLIYFGQRYLICK